MLIPLLFSLTASAAEVEAVVTAPHAPRVQGLWKSLEPEKIGSNVYATKEIEFTLSRWQETIFFAQDSDMKKVFLIHRSEGPFELKAGAEGAPWKLDLKVSRRALNLQRPSPALASTLGIRGCGLLPKKEVTVEIDSCGAFPATSKCPVEYEIVQNKDGRLYLGGHAMNDFKCSEAQRPSTLEPLGLKKVH